MLDVGADIESRDKVVAASRFAAPSSSHVQLTRVICLQHQATPLMNAARGGKVEALELLVHAGADLEAIDYVVKLPLQQRCKC